MSAWPGVLAAYGHLLDLPAGIAPITLLEGNSPLIPAPRLADELGAAELYIKFEGSNPTGSFKDRGMTAAISAAAHRGASTVICASTGNTAASAAAYAGRAGMGCLVLIPHGQVAAGKLTGAAAYGAQIIQIEAGFDVALDLAQQAVERLPLALVNSVNPDRLQGQKTLAFELIDQLGAPPDWLALPVGNAGNISAIWMGFQQLQSERALTPPRLLGVQAAGAAPLVAGHDIESPVTIASAIRIGRPARGQQALAAARDSDGAIVAVSDDRLLAAQQRLAGEGVWVEPASAAGLAGMTQQAQAGALDLAGKVVVLVCTGHGLKDPEVVQRGMPPPEVVPADIEALMARLGP